MKKFSIFMLAALALVACNKEQNAVVEQPAEADQTPVSFGAYVNRATTKAGWFDPDANLQLTELQNPLGAATDKGPYGFGVFAYYTNADNYDQTFTPNFMYNQQVAYVNSTSGWQYSPVKYWPNEFGTAAYSDDADKISFFAYAPYVTVNPASGKVNGSGTGTLHPSDNGSITEGIVGMKRNNAAGDPMIQYIVSPYLNKQVDLLWGVAGSAVIDADDNVSWAKKNGGTPLTFSKGLPYLNVEHPYATSTTWGEAQKLRFRFHHSLAALNVTVDTKTNSINTAAPAGDTKVFIRSVTFEGFDSKAALNLNNSTAGASVALWYNFDCSNELNNGAEFTIYDGRKDGKEGLTAATKELAAINPIFVQDTVWAGLNHGGLNHVGVMDTPKNLFASINAAGKLTTSGSSTQDEPILVIPNGDYLKVTIEYDVLTADSNLAGLLNDGVTPGSVVKNVISRYITKNGTGSVSEPDENQRIKLENEKKYTIKLHLGLNSVEFDAIIESWGENVNGGADLPHNNPNS